MTAFRTSAAAFVIVFAIAMMLATPSGAGERLPSPKTAAPDRAATRLRYNDLRAAPAKPLPRNPYAGNRGLTSVELANPPGNFVKNPVLPNSVPVPVSLPDLIDVPDKPPFISPAFQGRVGPALGRIPATPRLPYRTPAEVRTPLSSELTADSAK